MPKMRAAQVARPGGPFELVERDLPQPGAGWVRIKVQACGIWQSDSAVKEEHWPRLQYPRGAGHEVVGVVDAGGVGVAQWKPGQRVGVGWHGGHCYACRSGDFSQDTLAFSLLAGVRSLNEVYALEKVSEAYDCMISGKAHSCVVLTTGQ
jgi:D-arabinose 1-dehydrogenase-like Zn-dependent alcohol dehydrogenase